MVIINIHWHNYHNRVLSKYIKLLLFLVAFPVLSESHKITLATTTSTENSGLLSYLLPLFEKQHNIKIKIIATGTGRALKLAENGDVDMIMVHAPRQEKQFVETNYGVERKSLMHNKFLIIGPKNNPAHIISSDKATDAFRKIAKQQTTFISRGDNSGTHIKEQSIWAKSNIKPDGKWYKQVGQSIGKTLQIADELNAYTIIDSGTWLKLQHKTTLITLFDNNSKLMFNPYSVILVNPQKHPHTNYKSAQIFSNWLTSAATKNIINRYKINGQQLFFAN